MPSQTGRPAGGATSAQNRSVSAVVMRAFFSFYSLSLFRPRPGGGGHGAASLFSPPFAPGFVHGVVVVGCLRPFSGFAPGFRPFWRTLLLCFRSGSGDRLCRPLILRTYSEIFGTSQARKEGV